ncbi:hypothetical protein EJO63_23345 [Escherichia coli]|nr:hypothetical protein [Escherichia coli]EFN7310570.1 hypothetical protein [Escherichia coli]EFN7354715.1 hypothetical protein [Escherichia coli]EFN8638683.1 hypothetical protein [Escherichia coli]EFN8721531.1 hypothetical protein [Escherichia coli]
MPFSSTVNATMFDRYLPFSCPLRQGGGWGKPVNHYRLTPGFGGFTPVSYVTTSCRLTCATRI